ncbi:sugar O-acetyltransferase [Lactiplantibacillus paraplantarum]|uniref:acyltransferase n=1 Tax=Lactiplantibacillus paraplantarum TaxID=60520 RepID=UPI0023EEBAA1|nr:DapH/DapD/GlmU-related protein [Lactiplantibacillus paraplantarum]MCT4456208.1 sugar O-acetyltransferase [Lactiplantibacillus paraplantarum]
MTKTVFDKMRHSEPIDMRTSEYQPARDEMARTSSLMYAINRDWLPMMENNTLNAKLNEALDGNIDEGAGILPPAQIDFGNQMHLGKHSFINHSLMASAAGGIDIEEDVQIAPRVNLVTVNHDLKDKMIIKCAPVHIKKGAWIGANATILPGVTIGENSVVGAASVVTKDVPDNCVVVGNPARILKKIEE